MANYTITLKNCAFFAYHGVYEGEQKLGQRFYVDAVLDVDGGSALETDSLDETINYGSVFKVIERIVTGERRELIEALALEVAKAICAEFTQVSLVSVTVRKPGAPIEGVLDHVEVTVDYPQI